MPKITKLELSAGAKKMSFDLYYSRSEGFYLKDFPKEWVNLVNSVDEKQDNDGNYKPFKYYYTTEGELVKDATNVFRRFFEITAETKRMIIVNHGYGSSIRLERQGLGSWQGVNPR